MKASEEYEKYKKWAKEKDKLVRSYNAFCHIREFFLRNDNEGWINLKTLLPKKSGLYEGTNTKQKWLCKVDFDKENESWHNGNCDVSPTHWRELT